MTLRRLIARALLAVSLLVPVGLSPAVASQGACLVPTSGPHTMAEVAALINACYSAILSQHSGSSAPANNPSAAISTYQQWIDTTSNPSLVKIYDGAQSVTIGSLNTSTHAFLPYLTGGVSGGVPYFSATNIMGTSALLANHGVMVGAGAGAAPKTVTAGTDGQLLIGQTSADPAMMSVTGDVTITAGGVTAIGTNKVLDAMLRQSAALSIVGRSANSSGNVADISAGSDNQVFRRSGTAIGFGSIDLSQSNTVSASVLGASNGGTGISSLGTGVATFLGTPSSANLRGALTDETGTGAAYFQGGDLGTPSAGVLTNATGLPISSGVSGLGTGVATALATPSSANVAAAVTDETGSGALVFATSPTLVTPALGTPSSGTLTNATGLPISSGVSGLGTGVATFLGTSSSANLAAALTDETGTGAAVFAGSPALTGTPTAPTAAGGTNTTQIATTAYVDAAVVASTTGVASIAGNTGAFTLGTGLTNSTNDIRVSLSTATNVLGSDVSLNNTANYFDGPSMAQGTSGTWFASGQVTVIDSSAAEINCKLWDGTTVIASAASSVTGNNNRTVHLAGYLASPAANIRISCRDATNTSGSIKFNASGNSKDASIFGIRIAP